MLDYMRLEPWRKNNLAAGNSKNRRRLDPPIAAAPKNAQSEDARFITPDAPLRFYFRPNAAQRMFDGRLPGQFLQQAIEPLVRNRR
jgi:hypothetical protein